METGTTRVCTICVHDCYVFLTSCVTCVQRWQDLLQPLLWVPVCGWGNEAASSWHGKCKCWVCAIARVLCAVFCSLLLMLLLLLSCRPTAKRNLVVQLLCLDLLLLRHLPDQHSSSSSLFLLRFCCFFCFFLMLSWASWVWSQYLKLYCLQNAFSSSPSCFFQFSRSSLRYRVSDAHATCLFSGMLKSLLTVRCLVQDREEPFQVPCKALLLRRQVLALSSVLFLPSSFLCSLFVSLFFSVLVNISFVAIRPTWSRQQHPCTTSPVTCCPSCVTWSRNSTSQANTLLKLLLSTKF